MTKPTILVAALAALLISGCKKSKQEDTIPTDQTSTGDFREPDPQFQDGPGDSDTGPRGADLGEIIYFEFDSSDLDESSRQTLEQNAEWLREDSARTLTIEGHTDEVGTAEYNLGLGERRARAAKDYLVRLGIDSNRVSIITYGKEKPASTEDHLNRRSVFIATRK